MQPCALEWGGGTTEGKSTDDDFRLILTVDISSHISEILNAMHQCLLIKDRMIC